MGEFFFPLLLRLFFAAFDPLHIVQRQSNTDFDLWSYCLDRSFCGLVRPADDFITILTCCGYKSMRLGVSEYFDIFHGI